MRAPSIRRKTCVAFWKAGRSRQVERGWRWCRRNPAVASLLAAVILTLVTGES